MPIMVHTPNQSNSKTGVPPIFMNADGNALTAWSISGQTVQNGTPTPDNPIYPEFVGERTTNLITNRISNATINESGKLILIGNYDIVFGKVEPNKTYTLKQHNENINYVIGYFVQEPVVGANTYDNSRVVLNFVDYPAPTVTIPNGVNYIAIRVLKDTELMLNKGSTAKPFEPYGYKIQITCGSQTTPIYLGQVQTMRRIKKLVLTGQENWSIQSINTHGIVNFQCQNPFTGRLVAGGNCLCSHFLTQTSSAAQETQEGYRVIGDGTLYLRILQTRFDTVPALQQWLSDQYAAEMPVTVWYVLANEQTGTVNEPLAKIGDYTDAVASTNTGAPSIITSEGYQNLTVDTTVQPSSVSVSYNLPEFSECSHIYAKTDGLPQTKTGTTPLTFKASNDGLSACAVSSQTTQNGTPTPDAPIYPEFVGERTENLFDGVLEKGVWDTVDTRVQTTSDVFRSFKLSTTAGTYTISFEHPVNIVRLIKDGTLTWNVATNVTSYTITSTIAGDIGFSFQLAESSSALWDDSNIMLNTSPTAKPYEPYGYKLPLTCANTTTPSYIGSNPIHKIGNYADVADVIGGSVRRKIKKLVLTGEEDWRKSSAYSDGFFLRNSVTDYISQYTPAYCSHFAQSTLQQDYTSGKFILTGDLNIRCGEDQWTLTDWTIWLTAQYSAGTPVTVWYALASETTEQITPITIPTADGTNTLSVDTTVQPSSVTIGYDAPEYSEVKKVLDDNDGVVYVKS